MAGFASQPLVQHEADPKGYQQDRYGHPKQESRVIAKHDSTPLLKGMNHVTERANKMPPETESKLSLVGHATCIYL